MIRTNIFTIGGTVQAGEGLYIERHADQEILELCRSSTYAYVLTSRQMGKSSLMVRTAEHLRQEGICSVILDLTELGAQASADEWYMGLLFRICTRLGLQVKFGEWWRANQELGLTQRLVLFFQEVVLPQVPGQIVVFLDEIDITLALDFTDDFFTAIRYLYNARSQDRELHRLSFVLIGVATPSELIADTKRTPFNIGQRVDLTDFTFSEAQPLAQGLPLTADEAFHVLRWVFKWTQGHPYLTQRLCASIAGKATQNWTEGKVDRVVAEIFFGDNRDRDDNLQYVENIIAKRSPDRIEVLQTYSEILRNRHPVMDSVESVAKAHLKLSGLVKREGKTLKVRNPIYERVFDRRWIQAQWPVNWWQLLPLGVKISIVVITCLFAALGFTTVLALNQNRIIHAQAVEAERAAQVSHSIALAAQSQVARQAHDLDLALALALEAVKIDNPPDQAQLALSEAAYAPGAVRLFKGQHVPFGVAVSPDGRYILTGDGFDPEIERSHFYILRLWDINTGKEIRQFKGEHTGEIFQVAFTPNGRYALSLAYNNRPIVWEVETGKPVNRLSGGAGSITVFDISSDGQMVITGEVNGNLRLWNLATSEEIRSFKTSDRGITGVAFTPDSNQVLSLNVAGDLVLWNVTTGQISQSAAGEEAVYHFSTSEMPAGINLDISADGRLAVIPLSTQVRIKLIIWDLQEWQSVREVGPVTTSSIVSIQTSPKGRMVVSNDQNGIKVWDLDSGEMIGYFTGHKNGASTQTFTPDASSIISVSFADRSMLMWSLISGAVLHQYRFTHGVSSVTLSPDGRFALSADLEAVSYWDVKTGQEVRRFENEGKIPIDLTFAPDGKTAFATIANGPPTLIQLNLETGKHDKRLGGHESGSRLAIAPDGLTALTTGYNPPLILWDLQNGKKKRNFFYPQSLKERNYWGGGISISTDGGKALVGSLSAVYLWDLDSDELIRSLEGHTNLVWETAFLPDGHRALSSSSDHTLILWDLETGEILQQFLGHSARVNAFDVSLDGKTAISASDDGTLILWDLQAGQAIRRYYGHTDAVKDVDFSPDGRTALSASMDGTVIKWRIDLTLDELIAWVRENRYVRDLTCSERALYAVKPLCKDGGKSEK